MFFAPLFLNDRTASAGVTLRGKPSGCKLAHIGHIGMHPARSRKPGPRQPQRKAEEAAPDLRQNRAERPSVRITRDPPKPGPSQYYQIYLPSYPSPSDRSRASVLYFICSSIICICFYYSSTFSFLLRENHPAEGSGVGVGVRGPRRGCAKRNRAQKEGAAFQLSPSLFDTNLVVRYFIPSAMALSTDHLPPPLIIRAIPMAMTRR